MTLIELSAKIKEVTIFAEEKVEGGPAETLNVRRGRQRQAVEQLDRLRDAYTNELRRTAAFVVVIGDKREEFTSLAASFKCFTVDPDAYFADLVSRIPRNLYLGKESVSNLFVVLGRHIEETANELGIVGYPQLLFKQEYQRTLRNEQDFLDLVRQAVTDQLGGEIVGIKAAKNITKAVIEGGNKYKYVSIVLPTGNEKFGIKVANDLGKISSNVFFVVAGTATTQFKSSNVITLSEPTKEDVKRTLDGIKNSLKKDIA